MRSPQHRTETAPCPPPRTSPSSATEDFEREVTRALLRNARYHLGLATARRLKSIAGTTCHGYRALQPLVMAVRSNTSGTTDEQSHRSGVPPVQTTRRTTHELRQVAAAQTNAEHVTYPEIRNGLSSVTNDLRMQLGRHWDNPDEVDLIEARTMLLQAHPERIDTKRPQRLPSSRPTAAETLRFGERYADVLDTRLANTLIVEDAAEEREALSAHERITCHVHRRWAHECISSPVHVIVVTGHRWCRRCEAEASVAVDELTGSVAVVCTACRRPPDTAATRQIIRTCRASLATAQESRRTRGEAQSPASAA